MWHPRARPVWSRKIPLHDADGRPTGTIFELETYVAEQPQRTEEMARRIPRLVELCRQRFTEWSGHYLTGRKIVPYLRPRALGGELQAGGHVQKWNAFLSSGETRSSVGQQPSWRFQKNIGGVRCVTA